MESTCWQDPRFQVFGDHESETRKREDQCISAGHWKERLSGGSLVKLTHDIWTNLWSQHLSSSTIYHGSLFQPCMSFPKRALPFRLHDACCDSAAHHCYLLDKRNGKSCSRRCTQDRLGCHRPCSLVRIVLDIPFMLSNNKMCKSQQGLSHVTGWTYNCRTLHDDGIIQRHH